MNILITGASGLVATELTNKILNETDYKVILISRNKENIASRYCKFPERVKIYNINELGSYTINADICVNSAFSRTSDGLQLAESLEYLEQLCEICKKIRIQKFINISSQSVYGDNYTPGITENGKCAPSYMYALAKYSSELICRHALKNTSIKLYNIRLASVCENARFIKVFVKNIIDGVPINVSAPKQIVSFIDVRDVANALFRIIQYDGTSEGIFNLGTGEWYDIETIARSVTSVAKNKFDLPDGKIIFSDNLSQTKIGMNSNKFQTTFKWSPSFNLNKMIESIFNMLTNVNGGEYPISFKIVYGL